MKSKVIMFIGVTVLLSVSILLYIELFLKQYTFPLKDLEWQWRRVNYVGCRKNSDNNIKVGIIDTGVNLKDCAFYNINIEDVKIDESKESDLHGNLVTSVICNSQISEVSREFITFYSIDVGNDKEINIDNLILGIKKAIDLKCNIVNISLGTYMNSIKLESICQEAYEAGIIMIASSGDDMTDQYLYPASYDTVISVSSIDNNNEYLVSNNNNDRIDVCLPGEKIQTKILDSDDSFITIYGSSAASALMTTLVTKLLLINEELTNIELYDIIEHCNNDLGQKGKDEYFGYGLFNYKDALLFMK